METGNMLSLLRKFSWVRAVAMESRHPPIPISHLRPLRFPPSSIYQLMKVEIDWCMQAKKEDILILKHLFQVDISPIRSFAKTPFLE
jgi:hypothetical protein